MVLYFKRRSVRYTGYLGAGLKLWDMAAGALLIQEAAGSLQIMWQK